MRVRPTRWSSSSWSTLWNLPPQRGRASCSRSRGRAGAARGPMRSRQATTWLAVAEFWAMACSRASRAAGACLAAELPERGRAMHPNPFVVMRQKVSQARQCDGGGRAYLAEQISRVTDPEGDAVVEEAEQKRHDLGQVTAGGPQRGDGGRPYCASVAVVSDRIVSRAPAAAGPNAPSAFRADRVTPCCSWRTAAPRVSTTAGNRGRVAQRGQGGEDRVGAHLGPLLGEVDPAQVVDQAGAPTGRPPAADVLRPGSRARHRRRCPARPADSAGRVRRRGVPRPGRPPGGFCVGAHLVRPIREGRVPRVGRWCARRVPPGPGRRSGGRIPGRPRPLWRPPGRPW